MTVANILIISAGSFAAGESIIAIDIARQLSSSGFRPCLALPTAHYLFLKRLSGCPYITLYPQAKELNKMLLGDLIQKHCPDLIILSDFFTFEFRKSSSGIDFDFLRKIGSPIISIDSYQWQSTDHDLDFMSGPKIKLPDIVKEMDGFLRPCPLNNEAVKFNNSVVYRSVQPIRLMTSRKSSIRKALSIPHNAFVIFSANAAWEKVILNLSNTRDKIFIRSVPNLIEKYISELDGEIYWIRVAPRIHNSKMKIGNSVIYDYQPMSQNKFNSLLSISDLFITTNVVSTTLIKCLAMNIPSLFLHNSFYANNLRELELMAPFELTGTVTNAIRRSYPVKPFLMFPMGWKNFLTPLLNNNGYCQTFLKAEIFDEASILMNITRIRNKEGTNYLIKQRQAYLNKTMDLPTISYAIKPFVQ